MEVNETDGLGAVFVNWIKLGSCFHVPCSFLSMSVMYWLYCTCACWCCWQLMSFDLFLDWGWDFCNELVLANSLVDGVLDKQLYWTVVAGFLIWRNHCSVLRFEAEMISDQAVYLKLQCVFHEAAAKLIQKTLTVPGEQNPGPIMISVVVVPRFRFWNSRSISFLLPRLAPTLSFASGAVLRIILKVAQDVQSSTGVLL